MELYKQEFDGSGFEPEDVYSNFIQYVFIDGHTNLKYVKGNGKWKTLVELYLDNFI